MSELTLRYYFTRDSTDSLTFNCDYALIDCANIYAVFVPVNPALAGADYYLELHFFNRGRRSAAGNQQWSDPNAI